MHFQGLFLHISSFQGRRLELDEIDSNLVLALPEDEVFTTNSFSLQHYLVYSVAANHRRNPLVSPRGSEFLLFFPLICKKP